MIIDVVRPCNRSRFTKKLLTSAGSNIGSVWFHKRSDGTLRKVSYRIGVSNPSYEKKPKGKRFLERKSRDAEKNLITVFDTNVMKYNDEGRLCGRGGYKSIPLDSVVRVKVNGVIHYIKVI